MIETAQPQVVAEEIATVIVDELAVEDRLNDEVRDILDQYRTTCAEKASATRRCSAASRTP